MSNFFSGLILVVLAGILSGGSAAPIKLMHRFRYEHWALISVITGMLLLPWSILIFSVNIKTALSGIPAAVLINANLFSLAWGVANVLAGLCLVRIGFSLSVGVLTGVGLPIGVLIPMVFRGSGIFADAPSLFSRAVMFIVPGIIVMLVALALITWAGFGRESTKEKTQGNADSFKTGFVMAVMAGILQVGLSFAFVYSQGPVNDALRASGAGPMGMLVGVWAFVLPGGVMINLCYIVWRLYRNKNWGVFLSSPEEIMLSAMIGVIFLGFIVSFGLGMPLMGALGASIGFGVYQTMQAASSQAVGAFSGEWRGAPAGTIKQMKIALVLLLVAVMLFSAGKF